MLDPNYPERINRFHRWWMAGILTIVVLLFIVPRAAAQANATEPLAEVNGEIITTDEWNRALGARLSKLEEQIYELKRRELASLIAQRLLSQEAAKRKISVAQLLDTEVTAKVGLVTEKEIDDFYEANKARIRGEEADVRQKIRAFLQQQKLNARREEFIDSLRSQGKVVVRLQTPPVVRVQVSTEGAPFRGAPDAPVTIVEFADFECPVCKDSLPVLQEVRSLYRDQVRLVYRNFPLASHPQARPAAEAAHCAHEQGQFWAYHDALFAKAPDLQQSDYVQLAERLKLNTADFAACLSSNRPFR